MYSLGAESKVKLSTVDPRLRAVVELAIKITRQDFKVLEGARSRHRQMELYAQGRTTKQIQAMDFPADIKAKPGENIVTWTMSSRHFPNPTTGLSRAVDIVPFPVDWSDLSKFDEMSRAMFEAARQLNTPIRWGADWDRDGKPREKGEADSPHFELV